MVALCPSWCLTMFQTHSVVSNSTLYNPMFCSPPGSSIHGILQARILEWRSYSIAHGTLLNIMWQSGWEGSLGKNVHVYIRLVGFPDSSVGKGSACNAEDRSLILGSGRSAGKGIGYPLQYSWVFPVAQQVKNPPAMQETWVWSLGWEDPLEKWKAPHSSILVWRIPWTV